MTTVAKAQTSINYWDRPISILLVLFAIVAVWGAFYSYMSGIILGIIALLLFLGLQRPVWAMVALFLHQFTIVSYMIPTPLGFKISLQLLILLIVGLIIWRSYRQGYFQLGSRARNLLPPVIVLLAIAMISDLINSGFLIAWDDFRNWMVGLMILTFLPVVTRSLRDLKVLIITAFILAAASACIAILQYYDILGLRSATLIPVVSSGISDSFRSSGMSEGGLELAYLLSTILLVLSGLFILKGLKPGFSWITPALVILMAGGIFFSFTRSALIAVLIGLTSLVLLFKTRIKAYIVVIGSLFVAGLLIFTPLGGQYLTGRSVEVQRDSAISRIILWQAGLGIALDHPVLGIGAGQFTSIAAQYQSSVDSSLIAYEKREFWSYRTLGNEHPHNDFISIWLSYGTPALIIFICLFILIANNFVFSYRNSRNKFVRGVSIGLTAALIAYGVNALYHNMISTMPLFWIIAGLSLAVSKFTFVRPDPEGGPIGH